MISVSAARERISALAGSAFATPQSVYTSAPVSPPWTALKQAFFDDKPDLTEKTLMSYNQAFDIWQGLIGTKPIGEIRRPELKLFADHMRDNGFTVTACWHTEKFPGGEVKNISRHLRPKAPDKLRACQARQLARIDLAGHQNGSSSVASSSWRATAARDVSISTGAASNPARTCR
jgi:hypothetical protein